MDDIAVLAAAHDFQQGKQRGILSRPPPLQDVHQCGKSLLTDRGEGIGYLSSDSSDTMFSEKVLAVSQRAFQSVSR